MRRRTNQEQRRDEMRFPGWARWVLSAALTAAAVALVLPTSIGGPMTYTVVSGHSMEPTYHTYDLAVTARVGDPKVGDVIVYRVPDGEPGAGGQVIHRVVGGDPVAGFTTRGDNRDEDDIWHPRRADVVGRVVGIVPQGGRILVMVLAPTNLGLVALLALAWALVGSERPDRRPEQAPAPEPA